MRTEWDVIYSDTGAMSRILSCGRNFYNLFFKSVLKKRVTADTRLLEMGCGAASLGLALSADVMRYDGLDISPIIVEIARAGARDAGATNLFFSVGDCRTSGNEHRGKFDVVWSQGLVEHFDDPLEVIESHIAAAKAGGTVLISVPYRYSFYLLWYALTRVPPLKRFWPWSEQRFFSRAALGDLGRQTGLRYKVFFLPPAPMGFLLGIVLLELHKPAPHGDDRAKRA